MNVTILGNGGALNDGLYYNAFLLGKHCLCEAPPDIIRTLHLVHADLSAIDTIFISHFHADHCFGLPFLFLTFFAMGPAAPQSIRIIAPANIEEFVFSLTATAFTDTHPCLSWMKTHLTFETVAAGSCSELAGFSAHFFAMHHFPETLGFILEDGEARPFGYVADTLWSQTVAEMISLTPAKMLIDLNGEPSDRQQIHLSEEDLVTKGFPLSSGKILFLGTHLKRERDSTKPLLHYVRSGEKFEI